MKKTLFRIENLFLIVCLIWGIVFLVLNPPFQSPDEAEHFFKMWGYTQGTLRYQVKEGKAGLLVPSSFKRLYDFYDFYRNSNDKIPFYSTLRSASLELDKNSKVFLTFTPTSYTPLSYFPSFTVLKIMRSFDVKPLMMMYILRFCSLLVYLALCWGAIRIAPCKKWLFFLFALLPINVYQAASLSCDGITFGFMTLFAAYTLKLAYSCEIDKLSKKQIIVWDVLITVIGLLKFAYFPLILLYFLIPKSKFESEKLYFTNFLIITFFNILLISVFLMSILINPPVTAYANAYLVVNKFDLLKQIILSPFAYIKTVAASTFFLIFFLYQNMISSFGVTLAMIPMSLTHLGWFMLLLAALYKDKKDSCDVSVYGKGLIAVSLVISYLIIMTSVYLIYQTQPYIVGIQGRYLTPLILFSMFLFASQKVCLKSRIFPFLIFGVSQILLIQSLVTIIIRYY